MRKSAELIRQLCIEMGFKEYLIELRWGNEVIVYLDGKKLHFICDEYLVNCTLMRGGMVTPNNSENIICIVFPNVDIRNPQSLIEIKNKLAPYVGRMSLYFSSL